MTEAEISEYPGPFFVPDVPPEAQGQTVADIARLIALPGDDARAKRTDVRNMLARGQLHPFGRAERLSHLFRADQVFCAAIISELLTLGLQGRTLWRMVDLALNSWNETDLKGKPPVMLNPAGWVFHEWVRGNRNWFFEITAARYAGRTYYGAKFFNYQHDLGTTPLLPDGAENRAAASVDCDLILEHITREGI